MFQTDFRKKFLRHVSQSHDIRRSFRRGSILVLGSAGVGKTSTINHLFSVRKDQPIEIGKKIDTTTETWITSEYIISNDDTEYEVSDLQMGLIDSPGFNDPLGLAQDACNLYSIKDFFDQHPFYKGCYPNVILVFANAVDSRLEGENSNLAKSLKCIKELKLVDTSKPNVIGVMTHVG